jgi:MFS family permease
LSDKENRSTLKWVLSAPVVVAALGYFVDIYDLLLFSIVRMPSLKSMGLTGSDLTDTGLFLLNVQIAGLVVGGILWGVLGDKYGRLKILFGSILLYSLANLANAAAQTPAQYAIFRFIAGVGLAGELGAGITLVLESLPTSIRGWGTMLVATVGVAGAVAANLVARTLDWRWAYAVGGILGLALLFLRLGVYESKMFASAKALHGVKHGQFLSLFSKPKRFFKYLKTILVALPLWYTVGILITLAPEMGRTFGIALPVSAGDAVMWFYVGLIGGDFASGFLSQMLRSRRKAILTFLTLYAAVLVVFFLHPGFDRSAYYLTCVVMGITCGYWAVFVTTAAEQFGTNLRSTVAGTAPNFIRGSVLPITWLFAQGKTYLGISGSAALVGGACLLIAVAATLGLEETYGKNLDYTEKD